MRRRRVMSSVMSWTMRWVRALECYAQHLRKGGLVLITNDKIHSARPGRSLGIGLRGTARQRYARVRIACSEGASQTEALAVRLVGDAATIDDTQIGDFPRTHGLEPGCTERGLNRLPVAPIGLAAERLQPKSTPTPGRTRLGRRLDR